MARKLLSEKDKQIGSAFNHARDRARKQNLPFNITLKYLRDIAGDECPIFHTIFDWGISGLGSGKFKPNGPQLDRVKPELGYVVGNVAFISHRANRLKDNGTMQDHYDIADWIWSFLYANTNTASPVPKRTNLKSIDNPQSWTVSSTGTWEDHNDAHHHCGTISREDANHRPQTSGGDGMGRGGEEVGTSLASFSFQNYGVSNAKIVWIADRCGHLPDKS
jgi:hypothetical protein